MRKDRSIETLKWHIRNHDDANVDKIDHVNFKNSLADGTSLKLNNEQLNNSASSANEEKRQKNYQKFEKKSRNKLILKTYGVESLTVPSIPIKKKREVES